MKYKKKRKSRTKMKPVIYLGCWLLFLAYVAFSVYLLFFGFYRSEHLTEGYRVNLVPFSTIRMYIDSMDHFSFETWFSNLFGNVLLFMPLGFFLPLLLKSLNHLLLMTLCSALFSLTIELTQNRMKVGSFDVDDIILNTLGGIIGYLIFVVCRGIYRLIRSNG